MIGTRSSPVNGVVDPRQYVQSTWNTAFSEEFAERLEAIDRTVLRLNATMRLSEPDPDIS